MSDWWATEQNAQYYWRFVWSDPTFDAGFTKSAGEPVNLRRLGTDAASGTHGIYVCYEDPDNFVELGLTNE